MMVWTGSLSTCFPEDSAHAELGHPSRGIDRPCRAVDTAYNEFCAPSVDQCIDALVAAGTTRISLITTMFTPGGSHSELEIPAIIDAARTRHPHVEMTYAWPFDLARAAEFLADALRDGGLAGS